MTEPTRQDQSGESSPPNSVKPTHAKEAAREAEHRELLSLYSNDSVLLFDSQFRLCDCNERAPGAHGYGRDEFLTLTLGELRATEDPVSLEERMESIRRRGDMVFESIHRRKDRSTFPIETSVRVVESDHGTYYHATVRDVTERRQAEQALRESEARLAAFFDEAPLGYQSLDGEGRFLEVNPAWVETLGYEREEVIGKWFGDLLAPEYVKPFRERFPLFKERGAIHSEFAMVHKNGERRYVSFEGRIGHTADGAFKQTHCVLTDITERRRTEEALAASEERWRRILVFTPQIGISLDHEGHIAFVNQHFLELTGWTQEEALGADWFDLCIPEQVRVAVRGVFDTVMREQHIAGFSRHENEILTKDGKTRSVAWSNVVTRDAHEAVVGVTSLGIDITERKQAEEEIRRLNAELEQRVASRTSQLEVANKELEAFAYSVSHDLRAPLRAIDGFSAMVLEDVGDKLGTDDLEHLQRVRAGAQRMAVLIDELLGLSRASRLEMHCGWVDVSSMASEVFAELAEAQPERRVEIVVTPGLRARADAVLLRAILANLLGNAWKFTRRHVTARIEVGACEEDGERAFYVRDDGAGFDPRHATHLFGAFQRMHLAAEFEGDGIGLATVQRLVTRHGGRVWARAEVEKGATFYFTLPQKGAWS